MMKVGIHRSITELDATAWNRLVRDNNPLIKHEFFLAMERHQCVGEHFGWIPCFLAIHDNGDLIAAMPLYEKTNSYGEFVFDHAWANAYQQHGLDYYPKLVSAVPYTPATGQRVLCHREDIEDVIPLMKQAMEDLAYKKGCSGVHLLFAEPEEIDWFDHQGYMIRHDCQYHWHNKGYKTFDEFLDQLSSRKRKQIRRERRAIQDAGVRFRIRDGHNATQSDWLIWADFYHKTFAEKWGYATFNQGFFQQVASTLPHQILLIQAQVGDEIVAAALLYRSDTTLYGRHWGASQKIKFLHFETCYYQGIAYCIEQGLGRFEPGAQGEHKVTRGFTPQLTRSAHWLLQETFKIPIQNFIQHEQKAVADYMYQLQSHSPYKSTRK